MKNQETTNTLFPIFLKPEQLRILIVGGGNVAAEKLHFLLKSSPEARVTVVAPEVSAEVEAIVSGFATCNLVRSGYAIKWLLQSEVVVVATNNKALNYSIWQDARKHGKLINVADTPELCDFYMGSIVTKGNLKLAISTNGKSPTFAKRFRQLLEEILPEELPQTLDDLHRIRNRLKTDFSQKVKELNKITSLLAASQDG